MPTPGTRQVFQHVYLQGQRFQQGELPLSVTEELRHFEKLLEDVAHSLFLEDHPERQRVSAATLGVVSFDLSIRRLGKGSVALDLTVPRVGTPLEVGEDYAEQARELLERAFAGLAENGEVIEEFPSDLLPDLARMGTSLGDGESATWSRSSRTRKRSKAVLTSTSTGLLRMESEPPEPVEQLINVHVVGVVSEPLGFFYRHDGGERTLRGTFTSTDTFAELRAVTGFANRTPLVALTVLQQQAGSRRVVDVLNVEAVLPTDWAERLDKLGALQSGWLDGRGLPPTEEALEIAESFLYRVLDSGLPRPGIFPRPDGGVQLEWETDSEDIEVVVSSAGSVAVFHEDEDDAGFLGSVDLVFSRVHGLLHG